MVSVDLPARLERGKVRPGIGLGESLAPEGLARQDARQVEGLLRVGSARDLVLMWCGARARASSSYQITWRRPERPRPP
jgi:hypothetical protein